jgi:hypothetical protein
MTHSRSARIGTVLSLAIAGGAGLLAFTAQQPAPAPAPAPARGPAPTLTRPASPTKAADADGFLRRWLLLEPLKVPGQLTETAVLAAVKSAQVADDAQGTPGASTVARLPKDGDKVTLGGESLTWHAVDTTDYNVNLFHFAYALNKPTSNVLFWVETRVDAPREMPNVRLAIGSNAASVWYLNGVEVIHLYNDRQTVIDDGVSPRVTLARGPNMIRAAIVNAGGATDFCARFLDEHDAPIRTLTVNLGADGK